jgi:hypothetical protein
MIADCRRSGKHSSIQAFKRRNVPTLERSVLLNRKGAEGAKAEPFEPQRRRGRKGRTF